MRRSMDWTPRAGAWPEGMSLSLDDHAQPIRMLLFIRQAWELAEDLALPQLRPVPEPGASAVPQDDELQLWEQRWLRVWSAAWGRQALEPYRAPGTVAVIPGHRPLDNDDFWTLRYGDAGIDYAAFDRWEQMFEPGQLPGLSPLLDSNEVLPVLVAAWERGLAHITLVPWAGYYLHKLSATHLVTSFDTLASRTLFRRALAEWIRAPLA